MTWEFTSGHPQRLPVCNFLSQYYFYNVFIQKSRRFCFQILAKFEAAKTGSSVRYLRLTAVCILSIFRRLWHFVGGSGISSFWSRHQNPNYLKHGTNVYRARHFGTTQCKLGLTFTFKMLENWKFLIIFSINECKFFWGDEIVCLPSIFVSPKLTRVGDCILWEVNSTH